MSWTVPRTWVANEVVTASLMNTHLRDNMLETVVAKVTTAGDMAYATAANAMARVGLGGVAGSVGNPKMVFKTSSTTRDSTASLAADPELVFDIGVSETWVIELHLFMQAHTTPDMKVSMTGPSGITGNMGFIRQNGGSLSQAYMDLSAGLAQSMTVDGSGLGVEDVTRQLLWIYAVNSTTAGDLTFYWAQSTSDANATIVMAGSFMRGYKVA